VFTGMLTRSANRLASRFQSLTIGPRIESYLALAQARFPSTGRMITFSKPGPDGSARIPAISRNKKEPDASAEGMMARA